MWSPLSTAQSTILTDVKIVHLGRRRLDLRVNRLDSCPARSAPEFLFQPFNRFQIAVGTNFHAAVRQIPDPSAQSFEARDPLDEKPEPDALHVPTNNESACGQHGMNNSPLTSYECATHTVAHGSPGIVKCPIANSPMASRLASRRRSGTPVSF